MIIIGNKKLKQNKSKLSLPWKAGAAFLCFVLFFSMLPLSVKGAVHKENQIFYSESDDSQSDESQSSSESSGDGGESSSLPAKKEENKDGKTGKGVNPGRAQSGPAVPKSEIEKLFQPEYEAAAEAAYLVNGETGVVVYEKNPDTPLTSASLVKMMTCILVAERAEDLDNETVTARTWVFNQLYGLNASNADIRKGETLSLRELLYAMILPSGNEAALMAADYISGGYMPNFLYMMNARAKGLGCTGTYFADPNGLSEDNTITAHDAYLILKEFMSIPVLAEIAGTANYEMAAHNHSKPYYISSTNRFLFPGDPYAKKYKTVAGAMLGGKTGGLGEWQNFASLAELGGQSYYCIILHSPFAADTVQPTIENQENPKFRPALVESAELYSWAFSKLGVRSTVDTRQPVHEISVRYSTEKDAVRLLPLQDLRTVLPKDKDEKAISMVFDVPDYLDAPVKQGEVVGTVTLFLAGVKIGTSELVTEQDIERSSKKYQVYRLGDFVKSTFLKVYGLLILGVVIIYVLIVLYYNSKRKKKRRQQGQGAKNPAHKNNSRGNGGRQIYKG